MAVLVFPVGFWRSSAVTKSSQFYACCISCRVHSCQIFESNRRNAHRQLQSSGRLLLLLRTAQRARPTRLSGCFVEPNPTRPKGLARQGADGYFNFYHALIQVPTHTGYPSASLLDVKGENAVSGHIHIRSIDSRCSSATSGNCGQATSTSTGGDERLCGTVLCGNSVFPGAPLCSSRFSRRRRAPSQGTEHVFFSS